MGDAEKGSANAIKDEVDMSVNQEVGSVIPARITALITSISEYQDVYPVLRRGIQFLCQELSAETAGENDMEFAQCIKPFIEEGMLKNIVRAMLDNLDKPSFEKSCFQLMIAMVKYAKAPAATAIYEAGISNVIEKIVHNVQYLDQPACVQSGIHLQSVLVVYIDLTDNKQWNQQVSTTAHAMLTKSQDNSLEQECVTCLELLFRANSVLPVAAASANVVLKTLDQYYRQPSAYNTSFASAALAVLFRIFNSTSGTPSAFYLGFSAPILAAGLHHHQLQTSLENIHKQYTEKLLQAPLADEIHNSLTRLADLVQCPARPYTNAQMDVFHAIAMRMVLAVVWRDEACTLLQNGGETILANLFASADVISSTPIETALAQSIYYIAMHWPNEMWAEMQVTSTGMSKWIEVIGARCTDGSDELVYYLLSAIEALSQCEGFLVSLNNSNAVAIFQSILNKHHMLPHSTRKAIILISTIATVQLTALSSDLCDLIADVMLTQEANHSNQLESVNALAQLCHQKSRDQALLSSQNVRGIMRIMRSKLLDRLFTVEMLCVVVNTLMNSSSRSAFIDQGVLQVVSKAMCAYQWSPTELAGSNARLIIADVAHELDVSRNLSTLESHIHALEGLSFNTSTISNDALHACCCVVGALSSVKSLLPHLIEEGAIRCIVGMLRCAKQDLAASSEAAFAHLAMACFYALNSIVSTDTMAQSEPTLTIESTRKLVDGQIVRSQLIDCGVVDVIIGCLEESLRLRKCPPLLVDNGYRLLRSVLEFAIPISGEMESRWIAVVTSTMQRSSTLQGTMEVMFATTLSVLSRGNRSTEANGQHLKLMKVILTTLESSMQHPSCCTLLEAECVGAFKILGEIAKMSASLSDTLVSRCLGVIGKLIGVLSLSHSITAWDHLVQLYNAASSFATPAYVTRLINRLKRCITMSGVAKSDTMLQMAEDFTALKTLLLSTQAKTIFGDIGNHRLFRDLAAMLEVFSDYAPTLRSCAPFFLELGCLASQLISASQREEAINSVLCLLAEDTIWHSLRWIPAIVDRESSEVTLIVEFVFLRVVSGYTILEPALLVELLRALTYILRCSDCRDVILASSHASELQRVLWELIQGNPSHTQSEDYNVGAALLGTVSALISGFAEKLFSIRFVENGGEILAYLCLEALDSVLSEDRYGLSKVVLIEDVLQSTGTVLQHCLNLGAEHARVIIHHQVTRRILEICIGTPGAAKKFCQIWCLEILRAMSQSHGLFHVETFMGLSSNPLTMLISFVDILEQDPRHLDWKGFTGCLEFMQSTGDANDWRETCSELFVKLRQQTERLVNEKTTVAIGSSVTKYISDTVTQLSLKYGQLILDTSQTGVDCSLQAITQSGLAFCELFSVAPSFNAIDYSIVVYMHLKITEFAVGKVNSEKSEAEKAVLAARSLLNPTWISDDALAAYIDLAVAIYLSPSIRAAAWLFIDATRSILLKSMHRFTVSLIRAPRLKKSLLKCFSSLQMVYAVRWDSSEVESVAELLKIFSADKWSQEALLESVLALPQGLPYLFGLARSAPTSGIHALVMTFLFDHVDDIRHKEQRVEDIELTAILTIIKRNLAGRIGDTYRREWGEASGGEMLHSALKAVKMFARRKHCAVLCSDLGGVDTLYSVMCAPSQDQGNILLALEICCCLAGYGADLACENAISALELLFVFVENYAQSSRSRLGFMVLEYFFALGSKAVTLPLIQQCRTQVVPASARSYEEADVFIQQVYIIRQKVMAAARKPQKISDPVADSAKPAKRSIPLRESEIREVLISSSRNVVQCTDGENGCSYINLNTSEKSVVEPLVYSRLRDAIDQLSFVLDDPDMVMNGGFVSDLVPPLCEILIRHTITTGTICTVMQVLGQMAFINPLLVFQHQRIEVRSLLASCSLHQSLSLPFARHLARFCNSVVAEFSATGEEDPPVSLLQLLLDVLQNWKSEYEIVDECLATLHGLIGMTSTGNLKMVARSDILTLLNTVISPYSGNTRMSWNWLKSVLSIVDKVDELDEKSAQDTINGVVTIIRMFMSHSFMVGKALLVLLHVFEESRQLPLRHLIELDGVELLLTCLKLHLIDESITRSGLELLITMILESETSRETVVQLLEVGAATTILRICKKKVDSASICRMCLDLIHRLIQFLDSEIINGKDHLRATSMGVHLGDTLRKQSELMTQLLEVEVIPLLFGVMDDYSRQGHDLVLKSLLSLLKGLTKDERIRESAEVLHGLQELQQAITRIWEDSYDPVNLELAIDCLVNMACSDRALGHGWKELPMWLIELACAIQSLKTGSTGMSVEKIVGVLGRLVVDSTISRSIAPMGAFPILELLLRSGNDSSLERAIYGLLCTLSEDIENAQILIVFDVIPITAGRLSELAQDEETLLSCLGFLDTLILNCGESYLALQDDCVFEALELVVREYPEMSNPTMYHIASTLLEKISALDYQSTRIKPTQVKSTNTPQVKKSTVPNQLPTQHSDAEKAFQDLLREGAIFRVLWEAKPDTVENVEVKLAPSGDYLIFRRPKNSGLPRIERVFVSQLEVCPQRKDQQRTLANPRSPLKKLLCQPFQTESFEGDCVLQLKIRDEGVLLKASTTRERVYWAQALQWLLNGCRV